jgi:hypothetical protein
VHRVTVTVDGVEMPAAEAGKGISDFAEEVTAFGCQLAVAYLPSLGPDTIAPGGVDGVFTIEGQSIGVTVRWALQRGEKVPDVYTRTA